MLIYYIAIIEIGEELHAPSLVKKHFILATVRPIEMVSFFHVLWQVSSTGRWRGMRNMTWTS
jgi:hypothetical protein